MLGTSNLNKSAGINQTAELWRHTWSVSAKTLQLAHVNGPERRHLFFKAIPKRSCFFPKSHQLVHSSFFENSIVFCNIAGWCFYSQVSQSQKGWGSETLSADLYMCYQNISKREMVYVSFYRCWPALPRPPGLPHQCKYHATCITKCPQCLSLDHVKFIGSMSWGQPTSEKTSPRHFICSSSCDCLQKKFLRIWRTSSITWITVSPGVRTKLGEYWKIHLTNTESVHVV